MFTLLLWVVCGYIAGSIAIRVVPPRQPIDGWQVIVFGVIGSIVGGMVSAVVSGDTYAPAGVLWSIVGAVVVVAGWRWYQEAE